MHKPLNLKGPHVRKEKLGMPEYFRKAAASLGSPKGSALRKKSGAERRREGLKRHRHEQDRFRSVI